MPIQNLSPISKVHINSTLLELTHLSFSQAEISDPNSSIFIQLKRYHFNQSMINKFSKSPEFDVGDFLKFVGCKMASIKILKLNGTPEIHPAAWMLKILTKKIH